MWTFLAAEEPASLIVPDSVQKANLAEAVNKIVNMDFSTLFDSLIRESLRIPAKTTSAYT
jgi:small conductance mechanosensitive channel